MSFFILFQSILLFWSSYYRLSFTRNHNAIVLISLVVFNSIAFIIVTLTVHALCMANGVVTVRMQYAQVEEDGTQKKGKIGKVDKMKQIQRTTTSLQK